jgi:hypothetical protein
MTVSSQKRPRGSSTICLPIDKARYEKVVGSPEQFRDWLDQAYREAPELFPEAFAQGYLLKDKRTSAKQGLLQRRIECKASGEPFSIRPSFVLPYMTGATDDVEKALFLRRFGVPYWGLGHVFGKDPMYWYRLEVSLGRNSIVGTTVRQADLPEHLLADEHHQTRNGVKNYIATTVGAGCCLGAGLAEHADAKDLTAAYGVFKEEAQNVEPNYAPQTVNVDGWQATNLAWLALFPAVALLRCFLHGWLSIRARAKHLKDLFYTLGEKVWDAYRAEDRRTFAQRLRRLGDWARQHVKSAVVLEKVLKLCGRSKEYGVAYAHPDGHRTSNMLDRVMRRMNRYFDNGLHLHGSKAAVEQHCRAWALLYNFTPWSKATTRANAGHSCPAERLNKHRYHDNWLQNLFVSASLAGYRR